MITLGLGTYSRSLVPRYNILCSAPERSNAGEYLPSNTFKASGEKSTLSHVPRLINKPSIQNRFFRDGGDSESSQAKMADFERKVGIKKRSGGGKVSSAVKEKRRIRKLMKMANQPIKLPMYISAKGLANALEVPTVDIVKLLITLGLPPRSSEEMLVPEAEFLRIPDRSSELKDVNPRPPPGHDDRFPSRPPVVCILGHVNHGKTTLLDVLRDSSYKVVDQEPGGITQHISAFQVAVGKDEVKTSNGKRGKGKGKRGKNTSGEEVGAAGMEESYRSLTILDTPGHAAFEKIRKRGTDITDIAILVVDCSKGVQPQTLTSLQHLKKNKVPFVVALNKVDKKSANVKRTKDELMSAGVKLEDIGGDVQCVAISALKGIGVNDLLDTVLFQAALLGVQADRTGPAELFVVDSRVDRHRGLLVNGIVRCGTLRKGDHFVVGLNYGNIKRLHDSTGNPIAEATPGMAVEFNGLNDKEELPDPGQILIEVDSVKMARDIMKVRETKRHMEYINSPERITEQEREMERKQQLMEEKLKAVELGLDPIEYEKQMALEREANEPKEVSVLLKCDVRASIEVISDIIDSFPTNELKMNIVKSGVGSITETDVAIANIPKSNSLILGFNVSASGKALQEADRLGVRIETFKVIYPMLEWIKEYLSGQLKPSVEYREIGWCLIQEIFLISVKNKKQPVAGCIVKRGKIRSSSLIQICRGEGRDRVVLGRGSVKQLNHFQEKVSEVDVGNECGIMFSDELLAIDFEVGDQIAIVKEVEKAREFDLEGNDDEEDDFGGREFEM